MDKRTIIEKKKEILKTLKEGTKIIVKADGVEHKADFVKMNRTRFEAKFKQGLYTFPVSLFIRVEGEETDKEILKNSSTGKAIYQYKNVNPKDNKTNDCVVRAIAEGLNKSYREVLMSLTEIGYDMGLLFNNTKVYEEYLKQYNYRETVKKYKGTIFDFINNNNLKETDTYIIEVKGHLTVVKGNTLIDTWNCGYEKIKKVYVKWNCKNI